jgi:hypothetical protein
MIAEKQFYIPSDPNCPKAIEMYEKAVAFSMERAFQLLIRQQMSMAKLRRAKRRKQ